MRARSQLLETGTQVDFAVVGSGAAGGIVAKELAAAGFTVVVLEQGPYLSEEDFKHDELKYVGQAEITNDYKLQPNTFRKTPRAKAVLQPAVGYARLVGGGSVHFTANYWRFHEIDFVERSRLGPIAGTGFADWPIGYAELEPYYTKAEWELGVSGLAWRKSVGSPAFPALSSAAPPGQVIRRNSGTSGAQAGLACFPCSDGDHFSTVSGPRSMPALRLLQILRLRSKSQVKHRGHRDSDGRKDGTVPDSSKFLRAEDRDG